MPFSIIDFDWLFLSVVLWWLEMRANELWAFISVLRSAWAVLLGFSAFSVSVSRAIDVFGSLFHVNSFFPDKLCVLIDELRVLLLRSVLLNVSVLWFVELALLVTECISLVVENCFDILAVDGTSSIVVCVLVRRRLSGEIFDGGLRWMVFHVDDVIGDVFDVVSLKCGDFLSREVVDWVGVSEFLGNGWVWLSWLDWITVELLVHADGRISWKRNTWIWINKRMKESSCN